MAWIFIMIIFRVKIIKNILLLIKVSFALFEGGGGEAIRQYLMI